MIEGMRWYAVQDAAFDWDAEYNAGVFVLAVSPTEAAQKALQLISRRTGEKPDSGELKISILESCGRMDYERNEDGTYDWDGDAEEPT